LLILQVHQAMNEDRLRELIAKADTGAAPPGVGAGELSRLSRALYRRRVRQRWAVYGAAAVLLCAVGAWQAVRFSSGGMRRDVAAASPAKASDLAALKEHIAGLEERIARQEQTIDALLAAERSSRLKKEADEWLYRPVGREAIDSQLAQTAATMLSCADEEAKASAFKQSARESYNLVIRTFPQSMWAEKAKERLAAMGSAE
jgi:hypothetical protein